MHSSIGKIFSVSKSRGDRVSLDFTSPLRSAGLAAHCELEVRGQQVLGEGGKAHSVLASQYLVDNIPLTALFFHSLSQLPQGLLAKQAKQSSREAWAKLVMLHLSIDKVTAWPVHVLDCLLPEYLLP